MLHSAAFFNSTKSELITQGPALVTGITVHSTDATGKITIYDGLDAQSGRKFADFASPTTAPFHHNLGTPIFMNNGIYVVVAATIEDYTIEYVPLRGGSPLAIYPDMVFHALDGNEGE